MERYRGTTKLVHLYDYVTLKKETTGSRYYFITELNDDNVSIGGITMSNTGDSMIIFQINANYEDLIPVDRDRVAIHGPLNRLRHFMMDGGEFFDFLDYELSLYHYF